MIGLGVGIDYSLFIVTRARSARHDGMSVSGAIAHAAATSGAAVAFAGGTVDRAARARRLGACRFITVLGQAAAVVVVVVSVLAATTLLPALLGLCGDRIERLRIGRDRRHLSGQEAFARFVLARPQRVLAEVGRAARPPAGPLRRHLRAGAARHDGAADQARARAHRPVQRAPAPRRPCGLRPADGGLRPGRERGLLFVTADLGGDKDGPGRPPARGAPRRPRREWRRGGVRPAGLPDGTAALINVVSAGSPTSDVAWAILVGEARDEVIPAGGVDAHGRARRRSSCSTWRT